MLPVIPVLLLTHTLFTYGMIMNKNLHGFVLTQFERHLLSNILKYQNCRLPGLKNAFKCSRTNGPTWS